MPGRATGRLAACPKIPGLGDGRGATLFLCRLPHSLTTRRITSERRGKGAVIITLKPGPLDSCFITLNTDKQQQSNIEKGQVWYRGGGGQGYLRVTGMEAYTESHSHNSRLGGDTLFRILACSLRKVLCFWVEEEGGGRSGEVWGRGVTGAHSWAAMPPPASHKEAPLSCAFTPACKSVCRRHRRPRRSASREGYLSTITKMERKAFTSQDASGCPKGQRWLVQGQRLKVQT